MTPDDIRQFQELLVASEQRLDKKLEARIVESEQRLEKKLETRIAESEQRLEQRLQERILTRTEEMIRWSVEEMETRILRAFHGWAPRIEQRQSSHREVLRTHDLEIEAIKNRLDKLEQDWNAA